MAHPSKIEAKALTKLRHLFGAPPAPGRRPDPLSRSARLSRARDFALLVARSVARAADPRGRGRTGVSAGRRPRGRRTGAASEPASPSPSSSVAPTLDRTEGARRQRHQHAHGLDAAAPGSSPAGNQATSRSSTEQGAQRRRRREPGAPGTRRRCAGAGCRRPAGRLADQLDVSPISSLTCAGRGRHVLVALVQPPGGPAVPVDGRTSGIDPSSRSMTQAAPTVNEGAMSRTIPAPPQSGTRPQTSRKALIARADARVRVVP